MAAFVPPVFLTACDPASCLEPPIPGELAAGPYRSEHYVGEIEDQPGGCHLCGAFEWAKPARQAGVWCEGMMEPQNHTSSRLGSATRHLAWLWIAGLVLGAWLFLIGGGWHTSYAQGTAGNRIYLPQVIITQPPLAVIKTDSGGENDCYPCRFWFYGYLDNPGQEPVYAVRVNLEVTIYSDEEAVTAGSLALAQTEETLEPAFLVTLPGQPNPFSYELLLGKAFALFGEARAVYYPLSLDQMTEYQPLTIVSWQREDWAVSGVARNDQDRTLTEARVVVAAPHDCAWRDTLLDSRTLLPQQETPFHLDNYCQSDDLIFAGQGIAAP